MKKALVLVLAVVMLFSMVACAQQGAVASQAPAASQEVAAPTQASAASAATTEEATSSEGLTIAYSIPEMFSTFWKACIYGFENKCKEYGYEAVVLDPNGDTELQVSQLLNEVTAGVDAIVVSPIEKDTIGPTIDQINAAGVPCFAIDRKGSGDIKATLETDNYKAGVAMAEAMIKDYGETFKVLIVQGVLSDQPTIDRTRGAEDTFAKYPGITLVGDPSAGEYTEEAAMATVKNYLQSNPDLDCIFLDTDALLKGAYAALTEAGFTGKRGEDKHIGLYSVDGEGFVLDMIRAGQVDGTFSQYPIDFGADVVTKIKDYFDGKPLEEYYYYGGDVVTCDNIDSFGEGKLWGDIVR